MVWEMWFQERVVWAYFREIEKKWTHLRTKTHQQITRRKRNYFLLSSENELKCCSETKVKKLASHRMNNVPKIVSLCLENKAFIVLFIRVITHENLFCSYDTASNTSRIATPWYKYIFIYLFFFFFFFWFLSTVQLTFTEIQLIRISRGSAGCKFKKKKMVRCDYSVASVWEACSEASFTLMRCAL